MIVTDWQVPMPVAAAVAAASAAYGQQYSQAPHRSSCPVLLDGPNLFSHLTCAQDQSGKLQNNKIIRIATGSHKTTATLSPLYAENRNTIMYEIFNFRKDAFGDQCKYAPSDFMDEL